jgi:hypothetical protein
MTTWLLDEPIRVAIEKDKYMAQDLQKHEIHLTVEKFTHNLEAIRSSMKLIMLIATSATAINQEKHLKTLEQYGVLVDENESGKQFKIAVEHLAKIKRHMRQHKRARTAAEILPRSFLVSFVSEFDAFLGQLIKQIYLIKPNLLNQSGKQINYKDLLQMGSIDEAREYIISSEIESTMRKSYAEQFNWLHQTFSVKTRDGLASWGSFIEATERRHLFVHSDGRVSAQYLQVCKDHNVNISGLKVNDVLEVDQDYLTT